MKQRSRAATRLSLIVALIVSTGPIAGCNRSGYPIHFVVPNGYRGPLICLIDRRRGMDVPLADGQYTYRFPENGRLTIKDDAPFRGWHGMTVTYASGTLIPMDHEEGLPPDAVLFHGGGSGRKDGGQEYLFDFVGTRAEMMEYYRAEDLLRAPWIAVSGLLLPGADS